MKKGIYFNRHFLLLITTVLLLSPSCKKDWLEVKRDINLVVPQTLGDLRLLMSDDDNIKLDNITMAELSADDYYLPQALQEIQSPLVLNLYKWNTTIYPDDFSVVDWDGAFRQIVLANVILEEIDKIQPTISEKEEWNHLKGAALYLRGKTMFFLTQIFCKPYNAATAGSDLGLPIRKMSNTSEAIVRSNLQETYDFILADLTLASTLLRDLPRLISDPSKASAFGILARIALTQGKYADALEYSDKSLALKSELLDYNTLDPAAVLLPNPVINPEIVQYSEMSMLQLPFLRSYSRVSDALYLKYADDDLRKVIWFNDRETGEEGTHTFKGSYTANLAILFTGLTTAEMFLTRAECRARLMDYDGALDDVNTVLLKRYKTGTFDPISVDDAEVLDVVLIERRKELLRRGLRWSDIRRLNQNENANITLTRTVDGVSFTLPPGDLRYTLPIPSYVITYNGMEQNPR